MNVRRAEPEDAEAIAQVHLASWKTTYPGVIPQEYIDSLRVEDGTTRWKTRIEEQAATVLVSEDEAGIFGFAAGGKPLHPVEGYDAELYAIYLLASHQGRGAGRELVRMLADILAQQGFRTMLVWALTENSACGFYQRLGGVLAGEQTIEIGGKVLPEVAFGWQDIRQLSRKED